MGQFLSSIRTENSNDEIINRLIRRQLLISLNVEKVFRSVDRGLYYTNEHKPYAYRDIDWQSGDVHLSAPSTYATVIQLLDLHKGHKFLNIGSGIGYFSTVAGLLLGVNGVNHGIEILGSLIEIAKQKLEEFKQNSAAIDYFEFCEPVFIEGNACELLSVEYYDRVYCGASVTTAESSFMRNLIKIGGVLIMPMEGSLKKVIRKDKYSWKTVNVKNIPFSDLVVPEKCSNMKVAKFPTVEPLSLQKLCRSNIRASIRDYLNECHPGLQMRTNYISNNSFYEVMFTHDETFNQYLDEYCLTEKGKRRLRNIADAFSDVDESMSDLGSTSGSESIEDDDDDEENNTSEQCDESLLKETESDTKQKSPVAGNSLQNETLPDELENIKRMKMSPTSSIVTNPLNSQTTNRSIDISEMLFDKTVSDTELESYIAKCYVPYKKLSEKPENTSANSPSDSWDTVSSYSLESDDEEYDNDFSKIFHCLVKREIDYDAGADSEAVRELINYSFLKERKENELSKLLKAKIDLLPVTTKLKQFLNYNKID